VTSRAEKNLALRAVHDQVYQKRRSLRPGPGGGLSSSGSFQSAVVPSRLAGNSALTGRLFCKPGGTGSRCKSGVGWA
jgi:hypothetical protein